jgi:hypothetical protein
MTGVGSLTELRRGVLGPCVLALLELRPRTADQEHRTGRRISTLVLLILLTLAVLARPLRM